MKKSWKYGLIGAAAALAAVLLPYEIDRNDDGEFSYNSLLLGVYRRKRSDGEHATAVTLFNAPALTDESRKAREAAVRHVIEAAAEQELFADEDDPTEGAASAPAAAPVTEEAPYRWRKPRRSLTRSRRRLRRRAPRRRKHPPRRRSRPLRRPLKRRSLPARKPTRRKRRKGKQVPPVIRRRRHNARPVPILGTGFLCKFTNSSCLPPSLMVNYHKRREAAQ